MHYQHIKKQIIYCYQLSMQQIFTVIYCDLSESFCAALMSIKTNLKTILISSSLFKTTCIFPVEVKYRFQKYLVN